MLKFASRVSENKSVFAKDAVEADARLLDIRLMWLRCPAIAAQARPGQFVMVRCDGLTLPRPLSIHRVRQDEIALFFSVPADGKGTKWLADCRRGETVQLLGPLGNGFAIDNGSRSFLLIAGGMGVAPMLFLADSLLSQGKDTTLLIGSRTAPMLYPEIDRTPGLSVWTATDDGTAGHKGPITDIISKHILGADQVCACGPMAMYEHMANDPRLTGFRQERVQVSLEAHMACGHGVCYGCTIKTRSGLKQVCEDGPVFNLDELNWPSLGQP